MQICLLSVIVSIVSMLCVDILLSVVLLSVIMPKVIKLIVMLSIIMTAVIRLFAIALCVIMTPTDTKGRIHNTSCSS